jgi:hypothetical protein
MANTLAYFPVESVTNKKSFVALDFLLNLAKLFSDSLIKLEHFRKNTNKTYQGKTL